MTSVSLYSRPTGFASGSSSPSVRARMRRIVQYRRILRLLVARDLKVRYAGSALGYLWTVLDPLLMSLVYWFVFSEIFHRRAGGQFEPYLVYLISGQLAWSWFAGGVQGVARALRAEAQMVRSSNVPRELWVLRVVLSKGVEYLFGLPVLALFAIAYAKAPTPDVVLLPLAILLEALLLIGLGLILAPATVLFRDLERIVPIVLRVLFYISPVLYSVSNLPSQLRGVFSFNPTVGFLTLSRATFFKGALHEEREVRTVVGGRTVTRIEHISHWPWVLNSAIASVVILAIGIAVFVRLERSVLKEI